MIADTIPNAVELENVCFSRGKQKILDTVSLSLKQGDFMALLGPNGGGKTTLLKMLLGFLKPDSGSVSVFGIPPDQAGTYVGYVPQFSTIRHDLPVTVLEMTLMGAAAKEKHSFYRAKLWDKGKKARDLAIAALDKMGIASLATQPVHALSGGQRQRLLVARALMGRRGMEPFLLLLDEPTASIDPEGKGCFFEFLEELRHEVTLILVSHELAMTSPFFDQVALVNKTLTFNNGPCLDTEVMRAFIGNHGANCPLKNLLHHAHGCDCACDTVKAKALPAEETI